MYSQQFKDVLYVICTEHFHFTMYVSMSDVDTFIVTRSIVSVVKSISHCAVLHTAANCTCLS
jgi:uncharacterized protein YlbG (UPF0298 family)